jgi:hypothetical protein
LSYMPHPAQRNYFWKIKKYRHSVYELREVCRPMRYQVMGFLATDPEVRVRFPALPDFPKSSGSGTGSTQTREYNWGVNGVMCVAET